MEIGRKRRENDSGKGVVWRKQAKALAAGRWKNSVAVGGPGAT
jgi:hypothetical protein